MGRITNTESTTTTKEEDIDAILAMIWGDVEDIGQPLKKVEAHPDRREQLERTVNYLVQAAEECVKDIMNREERLSMKRRFLDDHARENFKSMSRSGLNDLRENLKANMSEIGYALRTARERVEQSEPEIVKVA